MKTTLVTLMAGIFGLAIASSAFVAMGRYGHDHVPANPLAIADSPYGQMLARLAKNRINLLAHSGQARWTQEERPAAAPPKRRIGRHQSAAAPEQHSASPAGELTTNWSHDWIDQMLNAKARRSNPNPMAVIHLKYLNKEMGQKFAAAYALDPTDYCIYNSYFMYLKENQWGSDRQKAAELALATLKRCDRKMEGPVPTLTGAAAALDLAFIAIEDARRGSKTAKAPHACDVVVRLAEKYLNEYTALRARAMTTGGWERLSEERRKELDGYADFVTRQFQMIKAWKDGIVLSANGIGHGSVTVAATNAESAQEAR